MEVRDIKGYEGRYGVTEDGRVWSYITHKFLEPKIQKNRYKTVCLYRNRGKSMYYVHRLVAEAFLPNPQNLQEVNHKDLNKGNNNVSNLEWIDRSGNMRHYFKTIKEAQE